LAVTKAVLEAHKVEVNTLGILKGSHAVLCKNPDVFTLWNARREILVKDMQRSDTNLDELLRAELDLVHDCLAAQPKSYPAWRHRMWVVEQGHIDLDRELGDLERFVLHVSTVLFATYLISLHFEVIEMGFDQPKHCVRFFSELSLPELLHACYVLSDMRLNMCKIICFTGFCIL
jgi:hypothetical protein